MTQAPGSAEDWKKRQEEAAGRKAALEAEAAAAEAEVLRLAALKKLAEAQAPPPPADPVKAATADAVAAAKAAKEVADAKKAQADAESAAFKAKLGEVPSSGIQGSVELSDKAGSMETALLAARATSIASGRVAAAVRKTAPNAGTIFIFPSGESPDLKALREFRSVSELLKAEFFKAIRNAESTSKEAPVLAAAGVALDAAAKLLGFFKSDFKVGGSELTADHAMLAEAIAGQLRHELPNTTVYLHSLYYRYDPASDAQFMEQELKPLSDQHKLALDAQRKAEIDIAALTAEAAKVTGESEEDKARRAALQSKIARVQSAVERLKKVIALYDTTLDRISADGKMDALSRQFEISAKLGAANTYVLTAKMQKVGGSHYTEKNLWTTFGAMPFKVMGGVIVSYSLFEAASARLLRSDILPVHGGFHKANEIAPLF